jgi:hypothetical protein
VGVYVLNNPIIFDVIEYDKYIPQTAVIAIGKDEASLIESIFRKYKRHSPKSTPIMTFSFLFLLTIKSVVTSNI